MSEKKYLSKHKRESDVSFSLTARDIEIIKALNRYRYMRTGQIKRLLFSDNSTLQSTRRRLKYLFHGKFIGRVMPLMRAGEGSGEVAYHLDKAGAEYLQDEELPVVSSKIGQVRHIFINHALDISEFRLNLEINLKNHPKVALHRFIADFELKNHLQNAIGLKRYRLYDEVYNCRERKKYVVYPDSLIILNGKGKYEGFSKLIFLEIDRATEGLSVIKNKVIGYNLYKQKKIFKKYEKVNDFTVLFQTTSQRRAENIRTELTDLDGTELIWVTDVSKVNKNSILTSPIWIDSERKNKCILKN